MLHANPNWNILSEPENEREHICLCFVAINLYNKNNKSERNIHLIKMKVQEKKLHQHQ